MRAGLPLGDPARDERRGRRFVDDRSFTKERLGNGGVLVLAEEALQRLRSLEESVARGSDAADNSAA